MNTEELKKWSVSSPEAKAMFAYLASRKRATRGGKPSDLKHIVSRLFELGFTLTPNQVEAELEKLQAMGLGVIERKANRRPRWRWSDNPAAVAKALGGPKLVDKPIDIETNTGTIIKSGRRIIKITRGDLAIEASPEDLHDILRAIGNR